MYMDGIRTYDRLGAQEKGFPAEEEAAPAPHRTERMGRTRRRGVGQRAEGEHAAGRTGAGCAGLAFLVVLIWARPEREHRVDSRFIVYIDCVSKTLTC